MMEKYQKSLELTVTRMDTMKTDVVTIIIPKKATVAGRIHGIKVEYARRHKIPIDLIKVEYKNVSKIKTGTKVMISPAWDKIRFHRNAGVGTVVGKWFKDFSVNFGRTPTTGGDTMPYEIVVPEKFLIVVKAALKGYRHPMHPTLEKVESFTHQLHGSGINGAWQINETGTSIRASNYYSPMDEGGYYQNDIPFTVIFPKKESMGEFKLQFDSGYHHEVEKYMLRDYLEDTIAYTLDELKLR